MKITSFAANAKPSTPTTPPAKGEAPTGSNPPANAKPPTQPKPTKNQNAPSDPTPVKRLPLHFDPTKTKTITRSWEQPVLQSKELGSIPNDYFTPDWAGPVRGYGWWSSHDYSYSCQPGSTDMGPAGVYRNVPVFDPNGNPEKQKVTRTLSATSYNQKKSFLLSGGVGLGLGAGVGVGVAAALGALSPGVGLAAGLVGAAVGAAAGGAIGYKAVDKDKIEEVWMRDDILNPTMTGYTEDVDPDVSHFDRCHTDPGHNGQPPHQECETWSTLHGWNHYYYPDISWRKVGDYTYPTLQHTAKISPGGAAALAGVAGAGAGALVATAVHFLPALL